MRPSRRAIEIGRPIVLLLGLAVAERFIGWWAAPLAVATVFAFAILVHDLVHNALHLRRPWDKLALSFFALFLIKSGHALRESHVRHHALCLSDADEEGRVAHQSIPLLVVLGPWLAIKSRWSSFRDGKKTRTWQLVETLLNVATVCGLIAAAYTTMARLPILYLGAVVLVTLSAPICGAKIPHSLDVRHPIVAWVRARVGRWTPAMSSVAFHELHHRAPRVPVALLSEQREEIERRPPSPCE
jgi:fatty acid desaturase